jgi:hypothetical protein
MTLPPQATPGDQQQTGSSAGTTSPPPLGDTARELANQAKREGAVKADAFRNTTSHKVNAIAEGARAAAGAMKQEDVAHMSQYLEQFAGGLQRLSGTIRDKSGEELLQELNRLARENPTMFMTACVAAGFGLGRFAKATRPEDRAAKSASSGTDMSQQSLSTADTSGRSTFAAASSSVGSPVTSSSTAGMYAGGTSTDLGGTAGTGGTSATGGAAGSSVGPTASSIGEGTATPGSQSAGSRNITNDEAGGLSS